MNEATGYELLDKLYRCNLSLITKIKKDGITLNNVTRIYLNWKFGERPDERSNSNPSVSIFCFSSPKNVAIYDQYKNHPHSSFLLCPAADAQIDIVLKKTYFCWWSDSTLTINTVSGRPHKLPLSLEEKVRDSIASGTPYKEVMKQYGISRTTAHRIMKKD